MDTVNAIKEAIRMPELLRAHGLDADDLRPTQLSCPFHGEDLRKSARVYPDTDSMYCWVCDKSWDVIGFVQEREEISFSHACQVLMSRYNIEVVTPDYEIRFREAQRPQVEPGDFHTAIEATYRDLVNARFPAALPQVALDEINEAWRQFDEITDRRGLTAWLERSRAGLAGITVKEER